MTIGAQLGIGALIARFQDILPMWIYDGNMLLLLSQAVMYVIAFPVFALMMRRIPPCRMTEPKTIEFKRFLVLLVVCFGAVYIGNMVGTGLMKIVEILTGTKNINPVDDLLGEMNLDVYKRQVLSRSGNIRLAAELPHRLCGERDPALPCPGAEQSILFATHGQ